MVNPASAIKMLQKLLKKKQLAKRKPGYNVPNFEIKGNLQGARAEFKTIDEAMRSQRKYLDNVMAQHKAGGPMTPEVYKRSQETLKMLDRTIEASTAASRGQGAVKAGFDTATRTLAKHSRDKFRNFMWGAGLGAGATGASIYNRKQREQEIVDQMLNKTKMGVN